MQTFPFLVTSNHHYVVTTVQKLSCFMGFNRLWSYNVMAV